MPISRDKSTALFNEAQSLFPGGVNSPVRAFRSVYGAPLFIKNARGCMIYDEDGNEFIDFCASWGPLILGHNHPAIKEAVIKTAENGLTFGAPTSHGNELGKMIIENNRFIDQIRFVSSGTEAVMSAIRLARGYTGKSKIIKFEGCYHGHADSLLVKAGSGLATFGESTSAGVPQAFINETIVLDLNDLAGFEEVLQKHSKDIACVIIEPIPANNGLLIQDNNYLAWLRQLCDEFNVLLIFDEVISGFRVGFEGAAGLYSIHPDIITYGKIIGGGMPVGAFGGRADIMAQVSPLGPVYQAGTLSANPVAMAAGLACLKECAKEGFYTEQEDRTNYFVGLIEAHATKNNYPLHIPHIGSIFWLAFGRDRIQSASEIDAGSMTYFKELHKYLLDNGVYLGPSGYEVGFISAKHTKKVLEIAAQKICDGLDVVFEGVK